MYVCMIYLLCMIKVRVRWCTCRENVITLSKLIGLLLLICPPTSLFGLENSTNSRNELARSVMETIFLVYMTNH